FAAAQVKDVDGQHVILIVVAEDVLGVAFSGRPALFFLELGDGGEHVTVSGSAFVFLVGGGFFHALAQGLCQIGLAAFQQKLHVMYGFAVGFRGGQVLHAGAEAALDVVLKTG